MDSSQAQALSGAISVATVIFSVFSLALGIRVHQATWLLRRPGLLLRSVVAAMVLVPVVATLLVLALDVREAVAIALIMLGVSPAAPLMLRKARHLSGEEDYAPSLQLVLATLSIVAVPLSLDVVSWIFPTHRASISPWAVASQVGKAQLLPLLAGVALRAVRPAWADRLARPVGRLAAILLAMVVLLVLLLQGKLMLVVGWGGYLAVAVTAVASTVLGLLLGGPLPATRAALAVACTVRNPGLALMIVQLNYPGRGAAPVVLTYVVASALLLAVLGRMSPRKS
jgi:BASS family bile acid:Na+ symporter